MAYVTVPKDLTKVKSKVVFGLTKRQLICFGGALLVGVPLFFLIRGRVPTSAAALIMVFAMLPGFLLALYEKHGQPFEVVVRQIVECCFIQPKERPYQTNNAYTALVRQGVTLAAQVGNDLLIHGASARSSDEAPVMGVERRGIVNMDSYVNRKSRKP